MKKLFILTLLVIYLTPCFGQDHEVVIQPNQEIKIAKVYDELTQQTLYEFTSYNYGYWAEQVQNDPPKNKWYNAHTALKFNLPSLPTGAYNISVKLEAYRGSYSAGDSRVVEVPDNLLFYDYDDIWYYAEIGNEYFVVDRSSGQLHDITSLYQSKIGQGYINFGIRQYQSGGYEKGYVNMYMHIYYDLPVTITAQNNFPGGKIYVDSEENDAPWPFTKIVGETATLKAKEQNDNLGYPRIWNDIEAPLNKSKWLKNGADVGSMIEKSFVVAQSDDEKTYEAGLRKNFKIDQTHKTEFDGDQTQQNTSWIVEQNSSNISTQSTRTINGKNYNFAGWLDNLSLSTTRSISPQDNQNYNVLYKYPNHANTTLAYSSNSQKKVVRTTDGKLHKVYESMGKVWYEWSTNNGVSWEIRNNGKPLSSNEAKLPSIDYSGNSYIFIVWQEKYETTYKIRFAYIEFPSTHLVFLDVYDPTIYSLFPPYSFNTTPVIAWANSKIIVVWRDEYGLNYRNGNVDCYGPTTWKGEYQFYEVTGTDVNSQNPTICVRKDGGATVYHLGWQQGTTAIKYCTLTPDAQNNITLSPVETASTGDGFNYRINPSISIKSDGYPTLVWIGAIYQGATTQVTKRSRVSFGWQSTFYKYGSNVESPTEYNSIITWSENNANKLYRPWSSIRTLTTIGKSVQLTNNVNNTQYAVAYRQYSPYDFQTSVNVINLAKENSIINQCGREGIVRKGDAEFYFILGDVLSGNEVIQFAEIPDSITSLNNINFNNYMETNSFQVNNNSNFYFSLAYGSADTVKALNELQGNNGLSYKLELVDAMTNEVIGVLKEVTTNENNISIGEIISYEVNTQSIGDRVVKLRVITNTNFEGTYYLANIISEEEVLGKHNSEKIDLSNIIVTSYELFQNYPNPFNPGTTIKFQLPEDGMISLKIYDILGNEVITLINEQKPQGKYEVNFNASRLASGVYIYKIQAGEFISSKKMILLK